MKPLDILRNTFLISRILGLAPVIITSHQCKKLGGFKIYNYCLLLINFILTIICFATLIPVPGVSKLVFAIQLHDIIISFTISTYGVLIVLQKENYIHKAINQLQNYANKHFLFNTKKVYFTSCFMLFFGVFSFIVNSFSVSFLALNVQDFNIGILISISAVLIFRAFTIIPLQFYSLVLVVGGCWNSVNMRLFHEKKTVLFQKRKIIRKKIEKFKLVTEDLLSILEEVNETYARIIFLFCLALGGEWIYLIISYLQKDKIFFPINLKMISLSIYLLICVAVCDFTRKQLSKN